MTNKNWQILQLSSKHVTSGTTIIELFNAAYHCYIEC